jgi:hypothetical protein
LTLLLNINAFFEVNSDNLNFVHMKEWGQKQPKFCPLDPKLACGFKGMLAATDKFVGANQIGGAKRG